MISGVARVTRPLSRLPHSLLSPVSVSRTFRLSVSLPQLPRRMASTKSQFIFPDDQPLVCLDAGSAWDHLTSDEKLYSHYLSRASWWGGLIVLLQTSPESPDIFR